MPNIQGLSYASIKLNYLKSYNISCLYNLKALQGLVEASYLILISIFCYLCLRLAASFSINEELPDLMAAADIMVSRAGANAICEILALRKPNILIPVLLFFLLNY